MSTFTGAWQTKTMYRGLKLRRQIVEQQNHMKQLSIAKAQTKAKAEWGKTAALVAAVLGGAAVGVGAVLAAPVVTVPIIIGAALSGAGAGAMGYFGIRSSGPK